MPATHRKCRSQNNTDRMARVVVSDREQKQHVFGNKISEKRIENTFFDLYSGIS
jgi:hypothetical protein